MDFSLDFVSVGANKSPHASDVCGNILAFGAANFVALTYLHSSNSQSTPPQSQQDIYPFEKSRTTTLPGHTDRVTCIHFVSDDLLLSGSADRTCRIWKRDSNNQWSTIGVLTQHTQPIVAIASLSSLQSIGNIFATSATDGNVCLWMFIPESNQVNLLQTLALGNKHALALALSYLPGSHCMVLAVGGTFKPIEVYLATPTTTSISSEPVFRKILSLEGHEDWVRCLQFSHQPRGSLPEGFESQTQTSSAELTEIMLASSSQDKYIRIWKFTRNFMACPSLGDSNDLNGDRHLLEFMNVTEDGLQLSTKAHVIEVPKNDSSENEKMVVMLDALLMGHDDWVYSARWHPMLIDRDTGCWKQPLALLSSSSDKSLMLWTPEEETGLWVNQVRVGEMGGNVLTFYNGLFAGFFGEYLLAHGYTGAIHVWKKDSHSQDDYGSWVAQVGLGGHVAPVMDLTWDPTSHYLLSTSLDQTTRLYGPWKRKDSLETWHELGRPQVHGYDLHCLCFIDKYRFASGAEEKVVRVFEMPNTISQSLEHWMDTTKVWEQQTCRPVGANLPALGLSNKAIFKNDIQSLEEDDSLFAQKQSYMAASSTPTSLLTVYDHPPFEDHLIQNTLWPEVDKLYGHGYEIIRVRCSRDGQWLLSVCKASSPENAVIRVFSTTSFKEIEKPLQAHALTVTNMSFSHSDRFLLSVSRDRSVAVFVRQESLDPSSPFRLIFKATKAHARIIWDADWSHNDSLFATASRDKTVKIWLTQEQNEEIPSWSVAATLTFEESVTAVAFAPCFVENKYLLAVGLENGSLLFYVGNNSSWNIFSNVDSRQCHNSTVTSLKWASSFFRDDAGRLKLRLASSSKDHSVRMFSLTC